MTNLEEKFKNTTIETLEMRRQLEIVQKGLDLESKNPSEMKALEKINKTYDDKINRIKQVSNEEISKKIKKNNENIEELIENKELEKILFSEQIRKVSLKKAISAQTNLSSNELNIPDSQIEEISKLNPEQINAFKEFVKNNKNLQEIGKTNKSKDKLSKAACILAAIGIGSLIAAPLVGGMIALVTSVATLSTSAGAAILSDKNGAMLKKEQNVIKKELDNYIKNNSNEADSTL